MGSFKSTRTDTDRRPYGEHLADCFSLEKPRLHVTRSLKRGVLAVTQLKAALPPTQPSQSIGYDEAYLVGLMVNDVPDNELWQDGRPAKGGGFLMGETAFYDLRRDPIAFTHAPHHSLHFYLPRAVLREMAEQSGLRSDGELQYKFGSPYQDPVVRHLGATVLQALESGSALSGLFLDHILHAVAAHVLGRYGDAGPVRPVRGGLSPRQLRHAMELMQANLDSDISLTELASACGLSVTHFARAFRESTGVPPHRWFQARRLEKAMALLRTGKTALSDVAISCGFANQSHFTRLFTRHTGVSPGQWRKING